MAARGRTQDLEDLVERVSAPPTLLLAVTARAVTTGIS